MRRRLTILTLLLIIGIYLPVTGQSLTERFSFGANLIGCRQDQTTKGAPIGQGLGLGGELFAKFNIIPNLYVSTGFGYLTATDEIFATNTSRVVLFPQVSVKAGYSILPASVVNPFIESGFMVFRTQRTTIPAVPKDLGWDLGIVALLGCQFNISDNWGLTLGGGLNYAVTSKPTGDPLIHDDNRKPLFWMAKTGVSYRFGTPTSGSQKEIEYTGGEELALDDLFREESGGGATEQDALDKLFQEADSGNPPSTTQDDLDQLFAQEEAAGETVTSSGTDGESSTLYASDDVNTFLSKIETLESRIESKSAIIDELKTQVDEHERTIAGLTRQLAGDYTGIDSSAPMTAFKANYEKGLQHFHGKSYRDAISVFTNLLKSDPNNRLASNCQYWIGECHNATGEYRQAIEAFNSVLRYSKSPKFDDALIMNGLCYMKVGDRINAREKFQQLLNRFPKSEYVPKAMRYLGSL